MHDVKTWRELPVSGDLTEIVIQRDGKHCVLQGMRGDVIEFALAGNRANIRASLGAICATSVHDENSLMVRYAPERGWRLRVARAAVAYSGSDGQWSDDCAVWLAPERHGSPKDCGRVTDVEIVLAGWADLRDPDDPNAQADAPLPVWVARAHDRRFALDLPTELLDQAEVSFAPIPIDSLEHSSSSSLPYPLELVRLDQQRTLTRRDLDHAMSLWCWMGEHCVGRVVELVNGPLVVARVVEGRLAVKQSPDMPEHLDYALLPVSWDEMDDEERAALDAELEASIREAEAGHLVDAEVVLEEMRNRRM